MASEAEVSHSPVLRTVEVERDGTSATDELTGQSLAQVGRYMYLKQDRRESLSSVSSDSGDVSNGREHLCDVEEENVVIVPEYNTPIIGYEVMEERARFTVSWHPKVPQCRWQPCQAVQGLPVRHAFASRSHLQSLLLVLDEKNCHFCFLSWMLSANCHVAHAMPSKDSGDLCLLELLLVG